MLRIVARCLVGLCAVVSCIGCGGGQKALENLTSSYLSSMDKSESVPADSITGITQPAGDGLRVEIDYNYSFAGD